MTREEILKSRCLIVVLNKSVTKFSTQDQIEDFTMNAWKLNKKRINGVEFIIGTASGVVVSCYGVTGIGVRFSDGRTFFSNRTETATKLDYTDLLKGENLIKNGIKTNKKEIQYLNF